MDKNKKEKQILYEWGKENSQKYPFLWADKKKNKPIKNFVRTDNEERKSELDDELPMYIYNF